MLNYETAVNATTTAMNAQGSATREQEKYNESLEARLNRLNTAWYSLASALGESIIYDGVVVVTDVLEKMTSTGENAAVTFGALPVVFGTVGSALLLMNSNIATWTINAVKATASNIALRTSSVGLSTSMTTLATSTGVAASALRGFLAFTGIGTLLAVIGVAVTGLTSAYSKHVQEQEKFETSMNKNIEAITTNKENTDELINKYNELSEARNSGDWNVDKEKEYLDIQQQLGEQFPSLISYIDSTGQYHLKNKDAIDEEIKATQELIEAQNKLKIEGASDRFNELNEQLNGSWYDSFSNFVYGSLQSRIEQQKQIIEAMYDNDADSGAIAEEEFKLRQLELQYQQTSEEIKGYVFEIANAMSDIEIDSNLIQKLQEFIYSLDLSNLNSDELESFSKEFGKIQQDLQKAINSGDTQLFNSAINGLNDLASTTKGFDADLDKLSITYDKANKSIAEGNEIIHVNTDVMDESGEATSSLNEEIDKQIEKLRELSTVEEGIVGVSENQVEAVSDAIFAIRTLGEVADLTASQEATLSNSLTILSQLYPQLTSLLQGNAQQRAKAIGIIEAENKANQALIKAYELAANGKLTAEARATMGHLEETNKRISNINAEIRALDTLQQQYAKVINEASSSMSAASDGDLLRTERFSKQAYNRMTLQQAELASLSNSQMSYATSLQTTIDEIDNYSKSSGKSNSKTKESIYLTDKYKQALEKVNLEIEKQQSLRENEAEYTEKYRKSLEAQIKLEKQKLALQQQQAKALESQIKSGKIQQTGTVSTSSKSSYSSGSGTQSTIWNFFKSKGFSDSIVAGIMGNLKMESNFNPSAVNPSSGAYGIAQWLGSRKSALSSYAKTNGTSMNNLTTQLNFLWKELNGSEKRTMNWLKSNQSASAATVAAMFDRLFERSEGTHIPQRQSYANSIYNQFAGSGGSSSSGGAIETGQEAIDNARSELLSIQSDILAQQQIIQELELAVIESNRAYYEHKRNTLNDEIALEEFYLSKYKETDAQYRTRLNNISKLKKTQADYYKQEIAYIEKQIKSNKKLTNAQKAELEETLISTKEAYYSALQEIDSLNAKIRDSYEQIADEVIQVYKDMIETQRDLALKALDDEIDKFEKTHERKIELLDEELSAYEKIINKQKEALEDEKDEADWNKSLAKRQEELQKVQSEYNKWAMDDSAVGRLRAEELKAELAELQEEINEMLADREHELQIGALDDLLEKKREQIEHEKELENGQYELDRDRLNKEREDLQAHYDNILNDERAFAEMRNKILADQVTSINNQLKNFSTTVSKNMQAIGKSISENLIDKIYQAQKLLNGINGGIVKGGSSSNLTDLINSLSKSGFANGGIVPHDGLTYVHGGERVLDKEDNRNFETMMKFIDTAKLWIQPLINQPSLPSISPSGNAPINISMPVTIENINGTRQEADNFLDTINKGLSQLGILRQIK